MKISFSKKLAPKRPMWVKPINHYSTTNQMKISLSKHSYEKFAPKTLK